MLCNVNTYYAMLYYVILCYVMLIYYTMLIPIISYEYNNPAMPPFTLRKL